MNLNLPWRDAIKAIVNDGPLQRHLIVDLLMGIQGALRVEWRRPLNRAATIYRDDLTGNIPGIATEKEGSIGYVLWFTDPAHGNLIQHRGLFIVCQFYLIGPEYDTG